MRVSGNSIRKYSTDEPAKIETQNVQKNVVNIDQYITEMNADISLRNIDRYFNLKIHQVNLKDQFLKDFEIKYTVDNKLALELEVQLFCGSESISFSEKIFWKGIPIDVTALIRKHLSFKIKYCDLPLFSSIIFRIKTTVKIPKEKQKKEEKTVEKKTIAWVNFRVFDHLKRLKTGKVKEYNFYFRHA